MISPGVRGSVGVRVLLLLMVVGCLGLPGGWCAEVEGRAFRISGEVRNAESEPLEGVRLEVGFPVDFPFAAGVPTFVVLAAGTSDGAGRYGLSASGGTTQTYTMMRLSKPGYATVLAVLYELMMAENGEEPGAVVIRDLVLPRASEISGVIVDEEDKPVAGAVILAEPQDRVYEGAVSDNGRTTSTADGRFLIDTMAEGPVQLQVVLDGKQMSIQQVAAPVTDLQLRVSRRLAGISGVVVNEGDDSPVAGATVRLYLAMDNGVRAYMDNGPVEVKSGADGVFRFDGLPAGSYVCYPEAEGFFAATEILEMPAVELGAGETTSGVVLEMTRGAAIYGTVYEAGTSEPLGGVKVTWESGGHRPAKLETVSADDGTYRLEGVPVNEFAGRVDAQVDGYSLQASDGVARAMAIARGEDGGRFVNIKPGTSSVELDLEMRPLESLSGTVVDVDGNPVEGVKVWAGRNYESSQSGGQVITESDGGFSIPAATSRNLVVFAEKDGWPVASVPVLPDGSRSGIAITVAPGGVISGMVLAPDGQPVGDVHLQVDRGESGDLTGMPSNLPDVRSGADGRFEIKDLPAGRIQLFGQKNGFAPTGFERIMLGPGERKGGVTLRLKKGYSVRGRVTDSAGRPVVDARVTADAMDPDKLIFANTQTAGDGTYELSGVEGVPLRVEVWAPGLGGKAVRENVRPDGGAVDFVVKREGDS